MNQPDAQWIYRAFDGGGTLLYIGRTGYPAKRIKAHRYGPNSPWFKHAARFTWQAVTGYERCKDEEARAIINEDPLFNRLDLIGRETRAAARDAYLEALAS